MISLRSACTAQRTPSAAALPANLRRGRWIGVAATLLFAAACTVSSPGSTDAGSNTAPAAAAATGPTPAAPAAVAASGLTACADDSVDFGTIANPAGAVLRESATPDAGEIASLANGQLLCLGQSTTDANGSQWLQVTAIPPAIVAGCAGNALCGDDQPVSWRVPQPAGDCRAEQGRYTAACASGWLPADDVEAYSMGLDGSGAET